MLWQESKPIRYNKAISILYPYYMNESYTPPSTPGLLQPKATLPSAGELIKKTLLFYKTHWKTIIGIGIPPLIFGVLAFLFQSNSVMFLLFAAVAGIAAFFARLALFIFITKEGTEKSVKSAYQNGLRMFFPFVWISILLLLTTFGGMVVFVIPGVLLAVWLSVSAYALFSENKRGIDALALSWHYTKGYWIAIAWRLFVFAFFILLMTVILFAPMFLFGAQWEAGEQIYSQTLNTTANILFFAPLSIIYSYLIFQSLKKAKEGVPSEKDCIDLRKRIIIFMILGVIGILALIAIFGFIFLVLILAPSGYFHQDSLAPSSLVSALSFSPFFQILLR